MRVRPTIPILGAILGLCGCGASGKSADGQPASPSGGAPATGAAGAGASAAAGNTAGSSGGGTIGPGSYALNPPLQCDNQFYVPNCTPGNPTTACGGKCSSINACQESTSTKPGDDVTFVCPRFMLFSDEMLQAAIDDGNSAFNYAVAGHDRDTGGIDGSAQSTCCQCYQLVFDYPKENQAWVDPNNNNGQSAILVPPPLIVQSFNTGTNGPDDFDIFLAAGGFGGNNACDPNASMHSVSGLYMYTGFPADGEPGQGGVKGAGIYSECKTSIQWVTTASLSSAACQSRVSAACNQIASTSSTTVSAAMTAATIRSCIQSNNPQTYYHLNWNVHAKQVECPAHLTEVTGCKLAPQGLPAVSRNVTTAAQAAADPSFRANASNGNHFSTTTMQDCCKPTCAWRDNVTGLGLTANGNYNSFYSCAQSWVPLTE
jgi:hypothetical protein